MVKLSTYAERLYNIFHSIPELSGMEFKTKAIIKEILEPFNIISCVYEGDGGLVYGLKTKKYPGNQYQVAFRSELDALKMPSSNIYHGCGHDAHTASLIAYIAYLQKIKFQEYNILFVFQSSEEFGNGAASIVQELVRRDIHVEKIFGIHNAPEISVNDIAVSTGQILANNYTNRLLIRLNQDKFNNLGELSVLEVLVQSIQSLLNKGIYCQIGELTTNGQTGIHADYMCLTLSFRSDKQKLNDLVLNFDELINILKKQTGVQDIQVENVNRHWKIKNDPVISKRIAQTGLFNVLEIPESLSSDDFCYYQYLVGQVCYLFIGSYASEKKSTIHSDSFEINNDFFKQIMKLYIQVLQEA